MACLAARGIMACLAARGAGAAAAAAVAMRRGARAGAPPVRWLNEAAEARALLADVGGRGAVTLDLHFRPGVAVIKLANDKARNALSPKMMCELAAAVDTLEAAAAAPASGAPEDLRAVVVVGDGGTFCSGADLGSSDALFTPRYGAAMHALMADTTRRLGDLPLVSVAAVDGAAVGGGAELSTATDFRIMTPTATIQFVQVARGVSPGWGASARLVELTGRKNALFLLGTGERLSAAAAASFNLTDAIVAPPEAAPPHDAAAGDEVPHTHNNSHHPAPPSAGAGAAAGGAAPSPAAAAPRGASAAAAAVTPTSSPRDAVPESLLDHAVDFLAPFLGADKDTTALRAVKASLGGAAGRSHDALAAAERAAFLRLWGSDGQMRVMGTFRKQYGPGHTPHNHGGSGSGGGCHAVGR